MTREDVDAEIKRLIDKFGITDRSERLAVTIHVWGIALREEYEPTQEEMDFQARKLKRGLEQKWLGELDDTPIKMRRCDGMD